MDHDLSKFGRETIELDNTTNQISKSKGIRFREEDFIFYT